MTSKSEQYPCPCCGFLTLEEPPPGTFFICPVCYWEDDNAQFDDTSYAGGANRLSLDEAKRNFHLLGAKSPKHVGLVRKPTLEEMP
jgi:hypothetical protein